LSTVLAPYRRGAKANIFE